MVRQFLWGQRFTREHFGYTSDCFWLPDTFGYSASIPQIMQSCGVKYFLTTKMSWNDTTRFPYDTFQWQGIDGTQVFTHMNVQAGSIDPAHLREFAYGDAGHSTKSRASSNRRLVSYGFGDGGGGPQFQSLEYARRMQDLDGVPKTTHTSVSAFMQELEQSAVNVPVYSRELYLELHRGTLTNQHTIKRNNRKGEIAIHNLEMMLVAAAIAQNKPTDEAVQTVRPLLNTLLVGQFHDILPGTCVPETHQENERRMTAMLTQAETLTTAAYPSGIADRPAMTLVNPTSFKRYDVLHIMLPTGMWLDDVYARQQRIVDLYGVEQVAISRLPMPSYGARAFWLIDAPHVPAEPSPFQYDGTTLTTPLARITFDKQGGIASFYDLKEQRELRSETGYALNTFLLAEEVSLAWDNWDIDADVEMNLAPTAQLISQEVVADGSVEWRLRSVYRLTANSTLEQDMIVYPDSLRIDFDTRIHWADDHCLLKAAFDTNVFAHEARFEMQFGHVTRPTGRSVPEEQAMFEVATHKFTDLSETRYGAAVLSDCKYGISTEGGNMRLSLHKGGTRPDYVGRDRGDHRVLYAFYPHSGGFTTENVVREGYVLNYPPLQIDGFSDMSWLAEASAPNVVIETIKPAEDGGRAFVLRLYEAEGARTRTKVSIPNAKQVWQTNMLEEPAQELPLYTGGVDLELRPFEIATLKVSY